MPPLLALLSVGCLGLAVGSFLNVCIWRLPPLVLEREAACQAGDQQGGVFSWLRDVARDAARALARLSSPPSHCPSCGTPIAWYHNIPVLSWLLLRGRCARCQRPISMRYPLVELATAVVFLVHLLVLGWGPLLAVRLAFAAALIVLFAVDLEHQLLPDVITIPGLVLGLVASAFVPPGMVSALLGVVLGGGALWGISSAYFRWRGIEGLGFGDVKMLAMIGAVLGWQGVLVTLFLASLSGAGVGLLLMGAGRGSLGHKLPFGTFLAMGALVASLWGARLVGWYLGLYPPAS